jgi:hypothetical protein
VRELQSTLNKKSQPYCLACLQAGYEPYSDLVEFGYDFMMFNKVYQQKVILPTLILNNKTVQQFNEDVEKKRDEKDVTD